MSSNKHIVKWAKPNTPCIRLKNKEILINLSKEDLKELHDEIGEFMDYYNSSFTEDKIKITDDKKYERPDIFDLYAYMMF